MTALAVFLGMLGFAVSLYGWGAASRRVLRLPDGGPWAVTLVLGLAGVIFVGGALNLARIAVPIALLLVAVTGLGLAAWLLKGRIKIATDGLAAGFDKHNWRRLAVYGLAVAIAAFVFATQLEPAAFNVHDDFQKYFAHPVRMLETGTLFGSPASALGSETLGGQAFLQGFLVAAFPIADINGVDAVFGLFLSLALAAAASRCERENAGVPLFGLLSVAAVILINPQYVNVSALYLGSALIMAAVALTADADELTDSGPPVSAAAVGLVYAALLALKTTFAVFVAIHLTVIGICLVRSARWRDGLLWSVHAALFTGLFLAPWLALHAAHYWAGLQASVAAIALTDIQEPLEIFSMEPLVYGGSMAAYTVLVILTCAIALVSHRIGSTKGFSTCTALGSALTLAVCYLVLIAGIAPRLAGVEVSLRYFMPIAIGIVPMVIGFAGAHPAKPGEAARGWIFVMAAALLAGFVGSFVNRVDQVWNFRSTLAFSEAARTPEYLAYNDRVLHGDVKAKIEAAQASIPAGAPVTAWIDAPFYLDYGRNPISDVDLAGLTAPWAHLPERGYVIWQYAGYATRQRGAYIEGAAVPGRRERVMFIRGLAAFDAFESRKERAQKLYDDGEIVVMSVGD